MLIVIISLLATIKTLSFELSSIPFTEPGVDEILCLVRDATF
nr:thermostable direct hemolysin-family toxin [Vibrio parahaemolyticus]